MQHLTTATNDPLPLFCRIADVDPHLRRYFSDGSGRGRERKRCPGTGAFLLMIILARQLNSRESRAVYDLSAVRHRHLPLY
jgi:hypothetical protein